MSYIFKVYFFGVDVAKPQGKIITLSLGRTFSSYLLNVLEWPIIVDILVIERGKILVFIDVTSVKSIDVLFWGAFDPEPMW